MIAKKKAPKADLERKRFAFFQIGLILAGALCLAAFEFSTPVFGEINKSELKKDTILSMPPIPKIFVASSEPKTKSRQPIVDEVKLVLKVTPDPVKAKPIKTVDLNLGEIIDLFGEKGKGTFKPYDSNGLIPADEEPVFPGNLAEFISKNMKLPNYGYPTSGIVYVNFIVAKDGKITDVKISKSLDPEHDRAAIDVVKKMPNWTPGKFLGKPIAVNYQLPIRIKTQ